MAAKKNQAVAGSQNDSGIDIEETVSTADLVHIKGQVEKVWIRSLQTIQWRHF